MRLSDGKYSISSPNHEIALYLKLTDKIYYAVDFNGENILWYSPISMSLVNGLTLGENPIVKSVDTQSVDQSIKTVWGIRSEISEQYEEIVLNFEENYSLVFRVYNDGVAYRFKTNFDGKIKIINEEVAYRFSKDMNLLAHVVGDFQTSYEKLYTSYKVSEVVEKEFISLPLLVNEENVKIVITESDVFDYPGMYIKRIGNNNRFDLQGLFPAFPKKWERGGLCQFNLVVTERLDYIAETEGTRDFPWRLMAIEKEAKGLVENEMVYKLARPSKIKSDWIKPGKVAWDWFNDWNLTGVDFVTGVNNRTYEYYIDFASKNKLEYVILDEGWSDVFDLLLERPNINVLKLVEYGRERNVEVVLWCVWHTLDRQMIEALDQFQKWGIAGVKVDFIDRDDQIAINFQERLAQEAAKRNLLVNIHGCSKPTGLHRTYPNIVNYEGVRGNEYNKFDKDETPDHNVNIVFTRMLAGPMDYTPGSMRNSTKGNFFTDNSNPMSHGTRCHQLAMYVVYYSPMQMLCDAPTAYEKYPDILSFLSEVPAVWDETIGLLGEVSKYVVVARRKRDVWYIGGLTDWSERDLQIDLSFLENKNYQATLFLDGVNAHRNAEDYQVKNQKVNKDSILNINLKPGGGMAIILKILE